MPLDLTISSSSLGLLVALVLALAAVLWQARRRLQRLNAALRLEATHLRLVVDHVADGIASADGDHRITSWNRAAERIFGFAAAEVLGKPLSTVIKDWPCANEPALREVTGRRKNGSLFPLELAVGDFHQEQRRHYTAVFRDITDRKHRDEALRAAKEAADEASQAKSRFLANMSHEIRTPLGAILGFSELLLNPQQSEEERAACIGAVRRNGDLLSNIINDILDLSKVEAGRVQVDKQTVRVQEVITDLASLLGLQAQDKGICLSVRFDGKVPARIHTDALRLRQILVNIVGNAIKFTSRGEVEVSIHHRIVRGVGKLAFAVRDTGPGISPSVAMRLFNPFAQGDSSRTRMSGGTGLGLVLARRLAQLLGGDVELTSSELGRGSVFTVTVDPGQVTEPDLPVDEAVKAPPPAIPLASGGSLDGVRILLVEDSTDNQLLIAKFMSMSGAVVEIANNGREGLEKAMSAYFDLVVMDIQMPVMDGYEAVSRLRQAGYPRPVIALTAHALREEQQRCLSSGFDGHLSKPINRQFLIERLQGYALTVARPDVGPEPTVLRETGRA